MLIFNSENVAFRCVASSLTSLPPNGTGFRMSHDHYRKENLKICNCKSDLRAMRGRERGKDYLLHFISKP